MQKSFKLVGMIAIVILILVYLIIFLPLAPYILVHYIPEISKEYSDVFPQQVGLDVELNQGLQLKPYPGNWMIGTDRILGVINTSKEPIEFKNSEFNLTVYCPDKRDEKWAILPRQFHTRLVYSKTIVLPQETDDKTKPKNTLYVSEDDFEHIPNSQLRLYIEGKGELTNKKYGAYIDIALKKPIIQSNTSDNIVSVFPK